VRITDKSNANDSDVSDGKFQLKAGH
jgi:hypothetical protein